MSIKKLILFSIFFLLTISTVAILAVKISPQKFITLSPVANEKVKYEVFGFAPYWTINKLDNVNYKVLTTMAYFDIPVNSDGTLDTQSPGYKTLLSNKAKNLFDLAHSHGTKVVLTFTQMNNNDIETLLSDTAAQNKSINEAISLVSELELDGVNIDYEYIGNPGDDLRNNFTNYIGRFTKALHQKIPGSTLTVSVYASSVKEPHIYNIGALSKTSDSIFMMAYDFATAKSNQVIPTSPLFGYKEGKYWYDVSSAVSDFLKVMPSEKLILGLPWYGYNYPVEKPGVKADRYRGNYYYYWWNWRRYQGFNEISASAQTYSSAQENSTEVKGWDDFGKVSWIAYRESGIWRMIFLDDPKSLKIKYDFAKEKKLGGVGIWALGFDSGTDEMWNLLSQEFGKQLAYKIN